MNFSCLKFWATLVGEPITYIGWYLVRQTLSTVWQNSEADFAKKHGQYILQYIFKVESYPRLFTKLGMWALFATGTKSQVDSAKMSTI